MMMRPRKGARGDVDGQEQARTRERRGEPQNNSDRRVGVTVVSECGSGGRSG